MSDKLNNGDIKGFSILIHAMKSGLSTIGAMGLSDTALRMETASKNNDIEFCSQRFPLFKSKLLSLNEKLSVIFPNKTETETKKKKGEMDYLITNIEKALSAADDFDGDTSLNIINDLLNYDFGAQNNDALEKAATALKDFNFDAAAEELNKLKKS